LRPQAKSLTAHQVSNHQDPARLIAERVARRLAAGATATDHRQTDSTSGQDTAEPPRARVIDFVSATPPPVRRSFGSQDSRPSTPPPSESRHLPVTQVAQSPWLAPFRQTLGPSPEFGNQLDVVAHPSQERFGVEEAAVSELVEFFENEKQCSVDPSGKPCDHCAMCSSRGF
jgi:hypothetical protein